jgi:hypothetical protein
MHDINKMAGTGIRFIMEEKGTMKYLQSNKEKNFNISQDSSIG